VGPKQGTHERSARATQGAQSCVARNPFGQFLSLVASIGALKLPCPVDAAILIPLLDGSQRISGLGQGFGRGGAQKKRCLGVGQATDQGRPGLEKRPQQFHRRRRVVEPAGGDPEKEVEVRGLRARVGLFQSGLGASRITRDPS
jgi:hypothetical protein